MYQLKTNSTMANMANKINYAWDVKPMDNVVVDVWLRYGSGVPEKAYLKNGRWHTENGIPTAKYEDYMVERWRYS